MKLDSKILKLSLFGLCAFLFTACDTDYSETGKTLLYVICVLIGAWVVHMIFKKGNPSLKNLLLSIFAGLITVGVFFSAATLMSDDAAGVLGIIATIAYPILMILYCLNK